MEQSRKRLFISKKDGPKMRLAIVKWGAENEYNTLVFSLDDKFFKSRNRRYKYIKLAKQYAFNIEAGGRDFSLLLPRRLFFFHRGLFRMVEGKRTSKHHCCPTNPETTVIIAENAHNLFTRAIREVTVPRIFHLLPDEGHETAWCACPACRAFTPAEQNIIVVNTAADALAKIDPYANISFLDCHIGGEAQGIAPRKNMFASQEFKSE